MCGRYSAGQLSLPLLAEQFKAEPGEEEDRPNWNVTPTSKVLVVTSAADDKDAKAKDGKKAKSGTDGKDGDGAGEEERSRQLRRLRWGLVPGWAKDMSVGNKMINVRSESVTDKPTFERLLASRRCILPADGFYEWQDLGPDESAEGKGRKKSRKQPFYVSARDGGPLALAGLWARNSQADPDGTVESCTILTTSANKLMSSIHHRMPVLLPPEAWDTWLDPDESDVDKLAALLVPAPDDMLQLWPVDTAVSSSRSNGAELIKPLEGHEARTMS
jgi:putative SOS response-associated peptidase YedK